MKHRALFIAFLIVALATFSSVPRASADPLTIMAIVGVVVVLSDSSADIVAHHSEDNTDHLTQADGTAKMHAKTEASTVTSGPEEAIVTSK
jgi:hypothetical protein